MRRIVTAILMLSFVLLGTGAVDYVHRLQHELQHEMESNRSPAAPDAPDGPSDHGSAPQTPRHHDNDCTLCLHLHNTPLLPCAVVPFVVVSDPCSTHVHAVEAATPGLHCRQLVCRGPPEPCAPARS